MYIAGDPSFRPGQDSVLGLRHGQGDDWDGGNGADKAGDDAEAVGQTGVEQDYIGIKGQRAGYSLITIFCRSYDRQAGPAGQRFGKPLAEATDVRNDEDPQGRTATLPSI